MAGLFGAMAPPSAEAAGEGAAGASVIGGATPPQEDGAAPLALEPPLPVEEIQVPLMKLQPVVKLTSIKQTSWLSKLQKGKNVPALAKGLTESSPTMLGGL